MFYKRCYVALIIMENRKIKSVKIQIEFEDTTVTQILDDTQNEIKMIETTDDAGQKHLSFVFAE